MVVGHEVWPAVSWQREGQGTTAQGKCALGLIHAHSRMRGPLQKEKEPARCRFFLPPELLKRNLRIYPTCAVPCAPPTMPPPAMRTASPLSAELSAATPRRHSASSSPSRMRTTDLKREQSGGQTVNVLVTPVSWRRAHASSKTNARQRGQERKRGGGNGGQTVNFFFFFPEGGRTREWVLFYAKRDRGMNPATPFPPSRVGAVQAEVL